MVYTKQVWQDGVSVANAARLGHIENGIAGAHRIADASDAVAFHDGKAYPLRESATRRTTRRVRWVGPTPPPIGKGYAVDGLDVWEKTP